MMPADTQGPMENAIRSRAPCPDPYQTSANADALPVLSILTGTVSPSVGVRNDRSESQFLASGSGNETAAADGRKPFAEASVSRAAVTIALWMCTPADSARAAMVPFVSMSTARARPLSTLIPRFTAAPSRLANLYAHGAFARVTASGRHRRRRGHRATRGTTPDRPVAEGAETVPRSARSLRVPRRFRRVGIARRPDSLDRASAACGEVARPSGSARCPTRGANPLLRGRRRRPIGGAGA